MREDERTKIRLDGSFGQIENIYVNKLTHKTKYSYTVHKFSGTNDTTFFELWYMRNFTNIPMFPDHPEISLNKIMKHHKGALKWVGDSQTFYLTFDKDEEYANILE